MHRVGYSLLMSRLRLDLGRQPRAYFLVDDVAVMTCEVSTFLRFHGFFVMSDLFRLTESLDFSLPFTTKEKGRRKKVLAQSLFKTLLSSLLF
jgi:hypothetical protein